MIIDFEKTEEKVVENFKGGNAFEESWDVG